MDGRPESPTDTGLTYRTLPDQHRHDRSSQPNSDLVSPLERQSPVVERGNPVGRAIPDDENLPEVLSPDTAGPWQQEKCLDDTNRIDDTAKYLVPAYFPEVVTPTSPPAYHKPLPEIKDKPVFTVRRKTMWIVIGVVLVVAAIIGGVVGGVVGSKHTKAASSHEADVDSSGASTSSISTALTSSLSSTLIPTSTLVTSTRSKTSTSSAEATTTGVCIEGTVASGETQNFLGLCKFCCSNGYCPPGPCTCYTHGTEADLSVPPETNTTGCPLEGLSDGYLGLCSFACNHGYCPESACRAEGCDVS